MTKLEFLIEISNSPFSTRIARSKASSRLAAIVDLPFEVGRLVLLIVLLSVVLVLLVTAAAELLDILPASLVLAVLAVSVLAVVAPSVILLIKELFVSEAGVVVSMLNRGV